MPSWELFSLFYEFNYMLVRSLFFKVYVWVGMLESSETDVVSLGLFMAFDDNKKQYERTAALSFKSSK